MTLREIITSARMKLKDLGMKRWKDPELVAAANEAKNELVKLIRQGKRDYFESTTSVTIPVAAAPNFSSFALPADFVSLKDLKITTSEYEWIQFVHLDRTDPRFKAMLWSGASFASGEGFFYYDVVGKSTVVLAPGTDLVLAAELTYLKSIADMAFPTDEPTDIPEEHHDFIVTFIVCECLRETNDPQLPGYLDKLQRQREMIAQSTADLQVREPEFVRGFMEGEW